MTTERRPPGNPTYQPPADFIDPRTRSDFKPQHWPKYNGGEAPPSDTEDLHERRCIEFLAAYYECNCRRSEMRQAREAGAAEEIVKACVQAASLASDALDTMQDRYAPIGFDGEPTMNGDLYADIEFHRAELPRILPHPLMMSSYLLVPGLDEIPAHELDGPMIATRISHGKMGA